jgi:hypothetical protein
MVYNISFQIEIPDELEVSETDLNEYLFTVLGMCGTSVPRSNPLYEYDLIDLNPGNLKIDSSYDELEIISSSDKSRAVVEIRIQEEESSGTCLKTAGHNL